MDSRTKQDFTRRITQSNRSELVVVLYDICFSYLDEAEKNLKEKDFDVYKEAVRHCPCKKSSERFVSGLL